MNLPGRGGTQGPDPRIESNLVVDLRIYLSAIGKFSVLCFILWFILLSSEELPETGRLGAKLPLDWSRLGDQSALLSKASSQIFILR